jgi:hypothetical protein
MKKIYLSILMILTFSFNATGQTSGAWSNNQQSSTDISGRSNLNSPDKNNIELMQTQLIQSIAKSCQENISLDCAINEATKDIVNKACYKEKNAEERSGCYTISNQILNKLINDETSEERKLYKLFFNKQPQIIEIANQRKAEEEEARQKADLLKNSELQNKNNDEKLINERAIKVESNYETQRNIENEIGDDELLLIMGLLYIISFILAFTKIGMLITAIFSPSFSLKTGILHRIGNMETVRSKEFNTVTQKYDINTNRSISLIKIGNETLTNIPIESGDRSIFDIIQEGNNTALILMKMPFGNNRLVYGADIDEQTESKPLDQGIIYWTSSVLILLTIGILSYFFYSNVVYVLISIIVLFVSFFAAWSKNIQSRFNKKYDELKNTQQ